MNKYNQLGRVRYNQLGRIKYNSQGEYKPPLYNRLALSRPVILDQNRRRLAVLENADDIILEQEINGIDQLTFTLPWKDEKRTYLQNENLVQLVNQLYIIRRVSIKRSGLSPAEVEVYAEAIWYDLQFAEPVTKSRWKEAKPEEIMRDLLAGTGWSIGTVTITRRRTLEVEEGITNRLEALSKLPDLFGGELRFNSNNMTVDFTEPIGRKSGAAIVYSKNLEEIEAIYDTTELVTKLYLYGKNNMTIEDANDGVPYLEDYSFTNKVRVRVAKDERFTNPHHLKEKGQDALKVLARPRASYIMKVSDLSSLSGLSHEEFFLGDEVLVFDQELGINVTVRIMSWKYNVKEPWNTELQIETKQPTLTELLTGIQDGTSFYQADPETPTANNYWLSEFRIGDIDCLDLEGVQLKNNATKDDIVAKIEYVHPNSYLGLFLNLKEEYVDYTITVTLYHPDFFPDGYSFNWDEIKDIIAEQWFPSGMEAILITISNQNNEKQVYGIKFVQNIPQIFKAKFLGNAPWEGYNVEILDENLNNTNILVNVLYMSILQN